MWLHHVVYESQSAGLVEDEHCGDNVGVVCMLAVDSKDRFIEHVTRINSTTMRLKMGTGLVE